MTDTIHCPDCGHVNPAGSTSCEACNYPFTAPAPSRPAGAEGGATPAMPPPRRRPPRARPMPKQSMGLWVGFAVILAGVLIYIGVTSVRNRNQPAPPVEGSSVSQQEAADRFRHALEHDSTDVEARLGLADVLFDTGNWDEAIVNYDKVLAVDSSRVGAIVDLGVCYYNTGRTAQAENLFELALKREPHHPVALFNLGIVNEQRKNYDASLRYFHQLLESGPPESMREPVLQAMQRVLQASGRPAPPLEEGTQ